MVKHLEKGENLLKVIGKEKFLVDFYADWCGPCQMLGPILEELTEINVLKVNVDEHEELAQKYGIMSIPTLIFFKDGSEIKKVIGLKSKREIEEIVKEI